VEGTLEATSERRAIEDLRRQHLHPVEIARSAQARGGRPLGRGAALAVFTRTVSTMVSAGVPLDRAVAFAAEQASHPSVAEAARHVCERLRAGSSLSDAMAQEASVFGPLFVAMVSAGEES
jgi:type II secretory pathway component PulF